MAHKFGASSIIVLNKGHAACSAVSTAVLMILLLLGSLLLGSAICLAMELQTLVLFVSTDNTYIYIVYMQYPGRNVYKLLMKKRNWNEKDMAAAIQACSENSTNDSLRSCKKLSSSKRLNVMYKVMCGSESEPLMRR